MAYKDPEKKREWQRKYYEENREKLLEYRRKYYEANREKELDGHRKYREENREKRLKYARKYHEENREKRREHRRKYCEENREKKRERERRRRARKRGATVPGHRVTAKDETRIKAAFRWSCPCCGKALDQGEKASPLDHFVPLARGGKDATWNLVPMCHKCNSSKHASDPLEWLRRKRYVTAFTRALIDSGHWIDHPHFRHINAPDVGSTE
jgi:hypothetical protein